MPYAVDYQNLPIGADETQVAGQPSIGARTAIPLTPELTPERQALVDRLYEQQGLVTRPIEREEQEAPAPKTDESKEASKNQTGAPSRKESSARQQTAGKSEPTKQFLDGEVPSFEDTYAQAKKGNAKALKMLRYAAGVGGYDQGFEVAKDGTMYYRDDDGKRQVVDEASAKDLYDRVAQSAVYVNRWYQKQRQGGQQAQQVQQAPLPREAIATQYDPEVLNALRAHAILQADPNGLISYMKTPYDIESRAAQAAYARAGAARRSGGVSGGASELEKWVRQDDGSYLVVDKRTERPLYATDLKGNTAPAQFAGRMAEYSDELKKLSKDLDDGETLHYTPRLGYYVVDNAGKPYPLNKYLAEKVNAEQPTGTAARKQTKTVTEPKQEAVKTNPVSYRNIGTLRLDDR